MDSVTMFLLGALIGGTFISIGYGFSLASQWISLQMYSKTMDRQKTVISGDTRLGELEDNGW